MRFHLLFVMLCLVPVVFAVATPAITPANCASFTLCASCATNQGCGWSVAQNACKLGNQTNSADGTSSGADWKWTPASCPATTPISCSSLHNCMDCASVAGCGWSVSQVTCKTGTQDGSSDGTSSGLDWIWSIYSCPTAPTPTPTPTPFIDSCVQYPSCSTCTITSGCGWSIVQNRCKPGVQNGSADGSSYGYDWKWIIDECPTGTPTPTTTPAVTPTPSNDTCVGYTGCSLCTTYAGCGWSIAQAKCKPGDGTGSADGSSYGSDWKWTIDECSTTPVPTSTPAATPSPGATPSDSCVQYAPCTSCTAYPGCGWSVAQSKCKPGTSAGSNDGVSYGSDWKWTTGECSATPTPVNDTCNPMLTCTSCTAYAGCGWSVAQAKCKSGNSSNSADGSSSGADWKWTISSCSSVPTPTPAGCSIYTACIDCTSQSLCGWSVLQQSCKNGTISGSNDGTSTSASGDWKWNTSSCSPTPLPSVTPTPAQSGCAAYLTCTNCTPHAGCGWSISQGICKPGVTNSSSDGTSSGSDWKWTTSQCPVTPTPTPQASATPTATPSDSCIAYTTTCTACTTHSTCGWSVAQSKCKTGSSSGSSDGTSSGSDWKWTTSQCTNTTPIVTPTPTSSGTPSNSCAAYTSCSLCTPRGGCGWSASQQACKPGTGNGSNDGTSMGSDWKWTSDQCPGATTPSATPSASVTPRRTPTPTPTPVFTPFHTPTPTPTPWGLPSLPCCPAGLLVFLLAFGAGVYSKK